MDGARMGKLRVTITHGEDRTGVELILWMLSAGICLAAITSPVVISTVTAIGFATIVILWCLGGVLSLCAVAWTVTSIYRQIRDRPQYEAIQRDTERNLRAYQRQLGSGVPPRPQPVRIEATRAPEITHE